MIKTNLIDSRKYRPEFILKDILNIIPFNNYYVHSYLTLAALIFVEYHIKQVPYIEDLSKNIFFREYGIKLDNQVSNYYLLYDFYSYRENPIYSAIMNNDKELFIQLMETDGFNKDQILVSSLYPYSKSRYSLLELCCYHGAVDCFKLLRTMFNSEITKTCLEFSFLGGNPEIMSECVKYQKPDEVCMKYAIISHNIDFVTYLMNEHNMTINLYYCQMYHNLEALLVYFDQTNDSNSCFINSVHFNIISLLDYFLSLGANINEKNVRRYTALHCSTARKNKEIIKFLLSHGADVNAKDPRGYTVLHFVTVDNNVELAELFLSHGANLNLKGREGYTALHYAVSENYVELTELLLHYGANVNNKDKYRNTALHYAVKAENKEITELLLSYGANANKRDKHGNDALHYAVRQKNKEITELLLSYGANVNNIDGYGSTALHYAVQTYNVKFVNLLLSHGADINIKNAAGYNALSYATKYYRKEIVKFVQSLKTTN